MSPRSAGAAPALPVIVSTSSAPAAPALPVIVRLGGSCGLSPRSAGAALASARGRKRATETRCRTKHGGRLPPPMRRCVKPGVCLPHRRRDEKHAVCSARSVSGSLGRFSSFAEQPPETNATIASRDGHVRARAKSCRALRYPGRPGPRTILFEVFSCTLKPPWCLYI